MEDSMAFGDKVSVELKVHSIKLDLCTGGVFREGFISIDIEKNTNPDVVLDITKEALPYEDGTVEEVSFMHGPEHIERHYWDHIFMEVKRVLIPNGRLSLGYPEWITCAKNYIRSFEVNDTSKRDYWLQTLYGRRHWKGDEHVTAVNSQELQQILESCGYYRVRFMAETEYNYNALMVAFKDPSPNYREKVMCDELGLQGIPMGIQEVVSGKK